MNVTLATAVFDYPADDQFVRLLDVYERSAAANMPGAARAVIYMEPVHAHTDAYRRTLVSNSRKLETWSGIASHTKGRLILTDADMIINADMSPGFRHHPDGFDIGITRRTPPAKYPYNGGVVFVNCGPRATAFFRRWVEVNSEMMNNKALHGQWKKKYGGINQAALGYLLETEPDLAVVRELPCAMYNACEEDWATCEAAAAIHVKKALRRQCLGGVPVLWAEPRFWPGLAAWHTYTPDPKPVKAPL